MYKTLYYKFLKSIFDKSNINIIIQIVSKIKSNYINNNTIIKWL